jgi:glycosyltransferase involved in cell wall biosynthesis
MPPPISVTIIARNEADRIAPAIGSVAWAAEVLVLEEGSSDGTADVARAAGARVEHAPWLGFGPTKNLAAELAACDWVLSLDADERVSPELADAIAVLADEPPEAAFRVCRRNRFAGRTIRQWPWVRDRCIRLYDRRQARFSDVSVHESVHAYGAVGQLEGVLEHEAYRDWNDYLHRQLRYAELGARQAHEAGRSPRVGDLSVRPMVTWLRHLIGRGYLLGGVLGWRLARLASRGTYIKYLLLREIASSP